MYQISFPTFLPVDAKEGDRKNELITFSAICNANDGALKKLKWHMDFFGQYSFLLGQFKF